MERPSRFSEEVRERAVRMFFEHRGEYASEWEGMRSIGSKIGCTAETLRKWVRQAEVDHAGDLPRIMRVPGTTDRRLAARTSRPRGEEFEIVQSL